MKTLERRLGLVSVIAISIAAMLGSGLFVLPGLASAYTGPSVWLAYVVAGLGVLPAAFSKAELATAMPESGGTYVYIDRTFGPLAGTVAGLGLWLSLLLKSAFALVGFGAYLSVLTDVPLKPVALLLLCVVVAVNTMGVRNVGKIQTWVVLIAVTSLVTIAIDGSAHFDAKLMQPSFTNGVVGFLQAVSFVYISFAGVTKIAAIAEEVENPGRNLPIGILASLAIVATLYGVVTLVLVGNVPVSELRGDLHPIFTLVDRIAGPRFGLAAGVLGVITMTSMANSGLLAASRFPYAMARNNLLPHFLRHVSSRFATPVPAIVLTGSLMGGSILLLDVEAIAKLASSLVIAGYLSVNVAVIVLRESSIQWYKPSFRSPLYPTMQVLGTVIGLVLLVMLAGATVVALFAITIPGIALFFLYGRRQTDRLGVLGRLGPRRDLLEEAEESPHLVLPKRAAAVVPLLGRAHGAEALAEIGVALSGGAKVEVVHISDVPEQIALDEVEDDPIVGSLKRRILGLATDRRQDVEFVALATHDHIRVVHDLSRRLHCEWLVMEWQGRTERGVLPFNPLGWLVDHLSCNLALYKDVGSRGIKSILAYAEPGPHDSLVAMTADHLAKVHGAELTFVRFVPDDGGEGLLQSEQAYVDELRGLCMGQPEARLIRGRDETAAITDLTAEFDLLVMHSPPDIRWWTQIRGSLADRIMRRSACSVLRLKAPRRLVDRSIGAGEDGPELQIDEFIAGDCIGARLPPSSKQILFGGFAAAFARVAPEVTAETIDEALWERERAQNTSIGDGLAVPHATVPGAERTHVGVFTLDGPMDYGAPDGVPVDVFFVTVGPPGERSTHLKLLSRLAKLVLQTRFLQRVRSADDDNELMAVLLASSTLHADETPSDPGPASSSD